MFPKQHRSFSFGFLPVVAERVVAFSVCGCPKWSKLPTRRGYVRVSDLVQLVVRKVSESMQRNRT